MSAITLQSSAQHIVISAPLALPAIAPEFSGPVGGLETRACTLARALAQTPNVDVTLAVHDRRAPARFERDGIAIVRGGDWREAFRQEVSAAWKCSRFSFATLAKSFALGATWPFRSRYQAAIEPCPGYRFLRSTDAVLTFGASYHSACVAYAARSVGGRVLLSLTSDSDVNSRMLAGEPGATRYGEQFRFQRRALELADVVLAQTPQQFAQLEPHVRDRVQLLPNPIELESWSRWAETAPLGAPREPFLLWIGRADEFHKRPLLMYELARACPQWPVVMIVQPGDESIAARLQAERPDQVVLWGTQPQPVVAALMQRAAVYVNTSSVEYEGMPNVLLQAAAVGLPILSWEVAAEWLQASGAGVCVHGDRDTMVQHIRAAFTTLSRTAAKDYLLQWHSADAVARQLLAQLERLKPP